MAKINCSVTSCTFNEKNKNECTLHAIQVSPCINCNNGSAKDETFCHSYKENH